MAQRANLEEVSDKIVEKILRAMQLQLVAAGVFGGVAPARVWLRSPHPMLDGLAPGDYADNEFGAGQVREMLISPKPGRWFRSRSTA